MRSSLIAAALLLAAPAAAQTGPADAYDDGDWWMIAPPGEGVSLMNGTGKRTGDVVELDAFMFYREPKGDENIIGMRFRVPVDCVAKTGDVVTTMLFFSDKPPQDYPGTGAGMQAFVRPSPAYQLACTQDRTGFRHFSNRSRRAVIAQVFAELPAR